MVAELMARAPKLCAEIGVGFEAQIVGQFDPPAFDEGCVNAVRDAAERLGYSHMDIVSGAGHDACWINDVAPTAMVMCPCVDGLSHNEAEEISPEWAAAGADVLFHAVVETAENRRAVSGRAEPGGQPAGTPEDILEPKEDDACRRHQGDQR